MECKGRPRAPFFMMRAARVAPPHRAAQAELARFILRIKQKLNIAMIWINVKDERVVAAYPGTGTSI